MTANAFGSEHVRAAINGEENTGMTPGEEVRSSDCLAGQGVLYCASTVLGGLDVAHKWLETPLPAMGGQRPIDFCDTFSGRRLVQQAIAKIEHGEFP